MRNLIYQLTDFPSLKRKSTLSGFGERLLLIAVVCGMCVAPVWGRETPSKPDVLFIAIDDMNDWTTLFDPGNPIQTPNLKRLAARGTFFSRAYCASAGCNPSRTAIMTGYRPTTSGVYGNLDAWREIIPDAVTLPAYFEQYGGYATRGAGKIFHHGSTGREPEGKPAFQEFFKKLDIRGPGPGMPPTPASRSSFIPANTGS